MIKVYIVDEYLSYIEGLQALLKNYEEIKVVGFSTQADNIEEILHHVNPDILIIDINLPKKEWEETIKSIKIKCPEIKIFVLTVFDEKITFSYIVNLDINAFRLKTVGINEIFDVINNIYKGFDDFNCVICPTSVQHRFNENKYFLSNKEKEVVKYIAEGLTNQEIAEKLFLSKHTIESHRNNAIIKMKAKNSQNLVALAIKNKLID